MVANDVQGPVWSKFTEALFEDSGWYKALYSYSKPLYWGKDQGCDFINKPCIDPNSKKSAFGDYFCDEAELT